MARVGKGAYSSIHLRLNKTITGVPIVELKQTDIEGNVSCITLKVEYIPELFKKLKAIKKKGGRNEI